MIMRQKLRTAMVFAAVAITLFSVVSTVLPNQAKAAGAGSLISTDVLNQVKAHQKYYWLRNCFYNINIDRVSRDEMAGWDFFEGGSGSQSNGYEIIGNIYGANEDATWGCYTGANVETAFNALGVTNPREAFCKIDGARYNNSDTYDYAACTTGAGSGEWDNTASNGGQTQGDDFVKEVGTWAPEALRPVTDVQNYVRYYNSFILQCDVTIQAGKYEEGSADDDDKYMVPVVNYDSKNVQNRLGIGIASSGSQVAIVAEKDGGTVYTKGEGVVRSRAGVTGPEGTVQSCNDTVEKLRGFAQAYQDYLNKNPGLEESPLDTAPAGSQKATCESEGGVLSWFLCPVLKLLDMGIDFLSDGIENMLFVDESKYNNDGLVRTWRVMRNIALLILIPMMLMMVIGTALEFGPFDAYTVKKALPRMVLAVMFITLSLPIAQFFVNLSNIVGSGMEGLITTAAGSPQSLSELYSGAGGLLFTSAAAGAAGGIIFVGEVGASLAMLGSLALTAFLALLIGYLVLVIRELLILVLILVAPLAILVWIFPANDRMWKIWKTTFTALLMMYPLIAILFASGKVFAGIIDDVGGGFTGFFLKILAFIAPLFFIPATFKYGLGVFGNIAGVINDRSRGLFDRQKKYRAQKRAESGERVGRQVLQKRGDIVRGLNRAASNQNRGRLTKGALRLGAAGVGGYNVEAALSARNASVAKELNDQIATGDDSSIRGLSVNKAIADRGGNAVLRKWNASTGTYTGASEADALKRVNEQGRVQYKTLGGAWVNEADVDEGHSRWGKDSFAKQTSLSYEMRKAMTDGQVQGITNRYQDLAKEAWGLSDTQAGSAWIGAAFENQNQHIEYKNTDHDYAYNAATQSYGPGKVNAKKLASEVYEKKGSYQLSQMSANTIKRLGEAYSELDAAVVANPADVESAQAKQKIQAVAETFMSRYGSSGAGGVQGMVEDVPILQGGQPGGGQNFQTNTPGAAHVAEAVRELAVQTGVYVPDLQRPRTESTPPGADIPRQN